MRVSHITLLLQHLVGQIAITRTACKSRQTTQRTTCTLSKIRCARDRLAGAKRHQGSIFSLLISLRHE